MKNFFAIVPRWIPAFLMMAIIFWFSSQPGDNLPDFLNWDYVVKKLGHFAGYAFLSLCNLHGLKYNPRKYWLAWLISVFYAATDEFHQSFVIGRNSSVFDVILFDNLGAVFALWAYSTYRRTYEKEIHTT